VGVREASECPVLGSVGDLEAELTTTAVDEQLAS
jgi:hypothetical protein